MRKSRIPWILLLCLLAGCGKEQVEEVTKEETANAVITEKPTQEPAQEVVPTNVPDTTKEDSSPSEGEVATTPAEENNEAEKIDSSKPKALNLINEVKQSYWEWDDAREFCYLSGYSETITVEDKGYEKLEEALNRINDANAEKITSYYNGWLEDAKTYAQQTGCQYEMERTNEIQRADERIVSFLTHEYTYLGGAHPNVVRESHNINPLTGEELLLKEIASDYDGLYQDVLDRLSDINQTGDFTNGYNEGYADVVKSLFYEEDGKNLTWTINLQELTIYFDAYVLGSYARGETTLTIPLTECEKFLKPEYNHWDWGFAIQLQLGEPRNIDVDDDGTLESIDFNTVENEVEFYTDVTIHSGNQSLTYQIMGTFKDAYVLKTKEGRAYFYLEGQDFGDYCTLYVFGFNQEKPYFIDTFGSSIYGHFLQDPERFRLFQFVQTLGTYEGYREYSVGADGMPVSQDKALVLLESFYREGLTSTRELTVYGCIDGVQQKESKVLPAGTVFKCIATDETTYMEMELEDGSHCILPFERVDWQIFIDGVKDIECFEFLPYVG